MVRVGISGVELKLRSCSSVIGCSLLMIVTPLFTGAGTAESVDVETGSNTARTGQDSQQSVDRNDLSSLLVLGLCWDAAAVE